MTSKERVLFNKSSLAKIVRETRAAARAKGSGGEDFAMDSSLDGFGIRVRYVPTKKNPNKTYDTWIFHKEFDGERVRESLGTYTGLSFDNAKAKASDLSTALLKGEIKEKRKSPSSRNKELNGKVILDMTISELWDIYIETTYFKDVMQESVQNDIKGKIRLYYKPGLGQKVLSSLSAADIILWKQGIKPISKGKENCIGIALANRCKSHLSGMLGYFIDLYGLPIANPCRGWSRRFNAKNEIPRDKNTSRKILERIGDAFRIVYPIYYKAACDILLLELLTGARRDEFESALVKYVYMDEEIASIAIPKGKAKYDAHLLGCRTIYLGKTAKAIVEDYAVNRSPGDRLFPQIGGGDNKITVDNTWDRLRSESKEIDFHNHDLRHLFSAVCKDLKIPTETIEALLGHAKGNEMHKRYGSAAPTTLQEIVEDVEKFMLERLGEIDRGTHFDLSAHYTVTEFRKVAKMGKTKVFQLIKDGVLEPEHRYGRTYIPKDQLTRVSS